MDMYKAIISQREGKNQYGGQIDSLEREYIDYFLKLGILSCPVSNYTKDISELLDIVDPNLIILTGGGDLPEQAFCYGHHKDQQENRTQMESELITAALCRQIPVLGICRGMQYLNFYFGGKIDTNEADQYTRTIIAETQPAESGGKRLLVNHYHKDSISSSALAEGLLPIAMDEVNGTVEAFIHKKHLLLGIQWHPERKGCDERADAWSREQVLRLVERKFD